MKNLIKRLGMGFIVTAVSLVMFGSASTASAQSLNLGGNLNLRMLSQFSLVKGELTAISATTLPAQLTIKLSPALKSRVITVGVDEHTIFSNHFFGKAALSQLTVGDSLQVFGRYNDQGVLQALSIKDESLQVTVKAIVGTVSAINLDAKTFTLSHQRGFSAKWLPLSVRVQDDTKLVSTDGQVLAFTDLQLNQQVQVKGVLNTQAKSLIASEVKVKLTLPVPPQPLPFSLKGELTAMSSAQLPSRLTVKVTDILPPLRNDAKALLSESIDMVTFEVNVDTKITSHAGGVLALADLSLGDTLVVQGNIDRSGHIIATIVRDESVDLSVQMNGTIDSLSVTGQSFVLVKADGTKVTVEVNEKTALLLSNGSKITFADLKIGYAVAVQGTFNSQTNILTASEVKATVFPQPLPFSLKGALTAISGTSLPARLTVRVTEVLPPLEMRARAIMGIEPINLVTFQVDASTRLVSKSGATITLERLALNDELAVQGNINADGTITATIVRDDSVDATALPLSGTVKSLNLVAQTFLLVDASGKEYTVRVSGDTRITVLGVANPTLANVYIGNTVKVSGILNANASVVTASEVSVTDSI